jgi:hypothetical protein
LISSDAKVALDSLDGTALVDAWVHDVDPVRVANGHPNIVKASNYVAPPNTENGVITVLAALLGTRVPIT